MTQKNRWIVLELSKKTRKQLRELLAKAYEKELDQHLFDVYKKFDDWKNKKINCWVLSDCIHEFHDGISRKLFNAYNVGGVNDTYMISRALALNLLQKEDIPTEAIAIVEKLAATLFENNSE